MWFVFGKNRELNFKNLNMKKLLLLFLLFSTISYSQSRLTTVLAQGNNPKWDVSQTVTDKVDTVVYFYMGYQNKKYTHITDIGSIVITTKSNMAAFMEKLWVMAEMEPGIDYSDKVGTITLARYPFSRNVFITNREGKYTYLTKSQINRMVGELENYLELFKD